LDSVALDRAAELIAASSYPVLVVGLECEGEPEGRWLLAFAESLPAPVLTTARAKGVFPDSHPLALGSLPGGDTEKAVVNRADLMVLLGLGLEELISQGWSCPAPMIHLGPTPGPAPAVPLVQVTGGIGAILEELAPRLRWRTRANWDVALLDRLKHGRASR
jgi:thiamine pyrophosphate-dependent acetolactate synthase large subunit-like protein